MTGICWMSDRGAWRVKYKLAGEAKAKYKTFKASDPKDPNSKQDAYNEAAAFKKNPDQD